MALAAGIDANKIAALNQNIIKADKLVAKAKSSFRQTRHCGHDP